MKTPSIPLRLALLPALAAAGVLLVAALSLRDLKKPSLRLEPEDPEALQTLKHHLRTPTVPRSLAGPELTEAEALKVLEKGPARAAIDRLWPLVEHREHLLAALLEPQTLEEDRLYLLGRFEAEEPEKALEVARALVQEQELPQGPLLLAAYEVLARHGDRGDFPLLAERASEEHQTKVLREEHRAALGRRLKPR